MDSLALVTANIGGIDDIKPFPQRSGIQTFYFTDQKTIALSDPAKLGTWGKIILPDYPLKELGPRLCSRYFKQQTHRLDEVRGFRWLAWADSCLRFKDVSFFSNAIAKLRELPERSRLLLVPHYKRATVREEYEFLCSEIRKGNQYAIARYSIEDMTRQVNSYEAAGLSLDAKLWCGTIWVMERSERMAALCNEWWHHTVKFGTMDQLSLGVLLKEQEIKPVALGVHLMRNKFFEWMGHPKLM